ncbi:MAG: hydroxypyruvate isomerase [Oceanicoccus sp.]|jgi:hydroxypyruvate isomerase
MPRFSANISMLFTEEPFLHRIGLAKAAGFEGIEIQFPYEYSPYAIKAALDDAELPLVLINCPAGDLMTGGQGCAAVPGREEEFKLALKEAYDYVSILNPLAVNFLAGCPEPALDRHVCLAVLESNLHLAFDIFAGLDVRLVTEAINTVDMPNFLLSKSQEVVDLIGRLADKNLYLQYDCYHMQRMEGDLQRRLLEIIDLVGHIQIADVPGRMEPGSGKIDFKNLFSAIDASDYDGFVGAEYHPSQKTESTFGWLVGNSAP